jgi:hypothetical protein
MHRHTGVQRCRANDIINRSLIKVTNARRLSLRAAVLRDPDMPRR